MGLSAEAGSRVPSVARVGRFMCRLDVHARGVVISVRTQPGARRDAIVGEHGGALKVSVSQPPEKGKANRAVAELLADRLELRRSQVRLLSGEASRDKRFLLVGVRVDDVMHQLSQLLAEAER